MRWWLLLLLGLIQMAADLAGVVPLRGLAASTNASPAPRVFSARDGLETFSTRFFLEFDAEGERETMALTPERYARIRGPYNRRNAYGAAVAYGPILAASERTRALFRDISRFALCGDSPLLRELGLPTDHRNLTVVLEPKAGTPAEIDRRLDPRCL